MSKLIVCVSGMSCCGKTSLLKAMQSYGWAAFVNEEQFPEHCDFQGIKTRSEIVERIGKGRSVFLALEEPLEKFINNNERILIDSIKLPEDKAVIIEKFNKHKILSIYLECPFHIRLERYLKRARKKDIDISESGLRARDKEDYEFGTEILRKQADLVIDSSSELDDIAKSVNIAMLKNDKVLHNIY